MNSRNFDKFEERENRVAQKFAEERGLVWSRMGKLSTLDHLYYLNGELYAIAEVKARDKNFNDYATGYLNLDKWMSLFLAVVGLGRYGWYVQSFFDGIYLLDISELHIRDLEIIEAGRSDRPDMVNDKRPVIKVPKFKMMKICDSNGIYEEKKEETQW